MKRIFLYLLFVISLFSLENLAYAEKENARLLDNTLKLTKPNGGESFDCGSDMEIAWEGVLPGDKVMLEFSSDNGLTWTVITDKATGLKYTWKHIPMTFSNLCLLRVSLLSESPDSAPEIEWQRCLGGYDAEIANSIIVASDGGYLVAGHAYSNNGDVSGNHGRSDAWLVKLDKTGQIQWQKCLGGSDSKTPGFDEATSIIETRDGGYAIAGYTQSNNGDVSGNHGVEDYWIVKLDSNRQIQWQKCLGGKDYDYAWSILETAEGDFLVAGGAGSHDGDVLNSHGYRDVWIVKLSQNGEMLWQKCLGGSHEEDVYSMIQTFDGSYVLAGTTSSNDGDVSGNHANGDYWVVNMDKAGQIIWQKCLGGYATDAACKVIQSSDSGFVIIGNSVSNDGNVYGNHGNGDLWVIKLDKSGELMWQRCRGGSLWDQAYSVTETYDAGLVVTGFTQSNNGDVIGNKGERDGWIVRLDSIGQIKWQKCLGGTGWETISSIAKTSDGGYILAGFTSSNDGDVSGNHSANTYDIWIIKLNREGIKESDVSDNTFSMVMPRLAVKIENDSAFAGEKRMLRVVLVGSIESLDNMFVTRFRAKIRYNKTILTMLEAGAIKNYNDSCEIAEVISGWDGSNILGKYEVIAGLGNAEMTELVIDEFSWLDDKGDTVDIETERTDGTFKILNICSEGGKRLVNPGGKEMIKGIFPNPAKDEMVIYYEQNKKTVIHIYLINILGERAMELQADKIPGQRSQTISVDLRGLSSGTYFLIMETEAMRQAERVEVVR